VTGIDAAETMIRLAREADPGGEYVVSDAAALPFDDATFDLVVAFNSLMDIDDMPGAVAEASRVLEPGGHLCICITHPTRDAGTYETRERFVIDGTPYLEKRPFELKVERGVLGLHFKSWAYPLETYVGALEDAGLLVEALREPPDPGRPFPNFLLLRAVKRR
jgi:SAM-dependent methyltransferase